MGGPDMAPQPPQRSEHPCSAVGAPRYSTRLLACGRWPRRLPGVPWKGKLPRVGWGRRHGRLGGGRVPREALVQESLRIIGPPRSEGFHDAPARGQVYDWPVRERVVAAAELEEHAVDEPDVREARLDPAKEIERGVVTSPRPETPAERLVLPLDRGLFAHAPLLEACGRDALEALELVHPLVIGDLAEEVGERREVPVVVGEDALEGLGVVLEPGVEKVTPPGSEHVKQPADVVVDEGDQLRRQPVPDEALPDSLPIGELLEDQEVPLFVVLLEPTFLDPLKDAPREVRAGMHVSDRNVGHVLPRLIRNAGDDLEDLELRQVARAPVEEVHREEERVRAG